MADDLNREISGRKIAKVWFDIPSRISIMVSAKVVYKGEIKDRLNLSSSEENKKIFKESLEGLNVIKVTRRAKNVLIHLSSHKLLLIHPKMTGHFLIGRWKIVNDQPVAISPERIKEKINAYIHFLIVFSDGTMMGFSDVRKFGKIIFGDAEIVMSSRDVKGLGPEPLEGAFTFEVFKKVVKSSRGRIKQFLLDQNKIAGIGNIYADEVLWKSKINPLKRVESITESEILAIFRAIKQILSAAVKARGTSETNYRDASGSKGLYGASLSVYGREGKKCRRCGDKIKRIVIGARSAHYCPVCQKLG